MLPRRHYNLCIQYMNKELIISVTQSISPGSGSGRSGGQDCSSPRVMAYSWMVFTASMMVLEVGIGT